MVAIESIGKSSTDMGSTARADRLHHEIVELATQVRDVDVASFETASAVTGELVSRTVALLRRAIELLDWSASLGSVSDEPASDGATAVDATGEWPRDHAAELGDLAFLGAAHLRSRLRALSELPETADRWVWVGTCGSALRHITRALAALEESLTRATGRIATITLDTELEIALQLRGRFSDLRDSLSGPALTVPGALERRLRRVGGGIAVLIGKPVYSHVRIPDRIQLRSLQTRVLGWLRVKGSTEEGLRLFQDIVCFLDMLRLISRRQELVAHDAAVIEDALVDLTAAGTVSGPLLGRLHTLRGRDAAIDALLAVRQRSAEPWITALLPLAPSGAKEGLG